MPTIEIVSDLVCPWCFIGLRRLAIAIEQVRRDVPEFSCRKVWRPFFLNPDTPPEGEPYLSFLVAKFGSREAVESLFERVRQAGSAYGIDYAFDKISRRANTLQAHRLIHWAQQRGDAEPLVERLFSAYFQRGENIGDLGLLARIAGQCGYPEEAAAAYLASTQDAETVRTLEAEARAAGIRQVPTFIVDRKLVVVGAEDPAILAEALRQSLAASRPHQLSG